KLEGRALRSIVAQPFRAAVSAASPSLRSPRAPRLARRLSYPDAAERRPPARARAPEIDHAVPPLDRAIHQRAERHVAGDRAPQRQPVPPQPAEIAVDQLDVDPVDEERVLPEPLERRLP